jgi:septal ring factor EnvC (AmiA/AmiB activator)
MKARWVLLLALSAGTALGAPASEWLAPSSNVEAEEAPPPQLPSELNDDAEQLRDELESLKKESIERRALTVARGRAYVRLARAGLLPLSQGLDGFAAHTSRLERLRRALGRDLQRDKLITTRQIELARALQSIDAIPAGERNAAARARAAILAAEERDQAFQRAFHSQWSPSSSSTAVYAARVSADDLPRGGFAGQRGRLPFPMPGRSEIQSVRSPSGTGKAVLMSSSWGSAVRAVYPGRVAFADEYPNLGNTVIIDHGERFYTVSAHLQRISVQVGDELTLGQRIGTVGTYDQKPALLFEVRDGQNTLNTPEWFGI